MGITFRRQWDGVPREAWPQLNKMAQWLEALLNLQTDGSLVIDVYDQVAYVPGPDDFRALIVQGNNPYGWVRCRTQQDGELYAQNMGQGVLKGNVAGWPVITINNAIWAVGLLVITPDEPITAVAGAPIAVFGVEPSTFNGTYIINAVYGDGSFSVTLATDPGDYVDGGVLVYETVEATNPMANPAYEANGNRFVPPGTFVWMRPRYLRDDDAVQEYDFWHCCDDLPPVQPVMRHSGQRGRQRRTVVQQHQTNVEATTVFVSQGGRRTSSRRRAPTPVCCDSRKAFKDVSNQPIQSGTRNNVALPSQQYEAWAMAPTADTALTGFTESDGSTPKHGRKCYIYNVSDRLITVEGEYPSSTAANRVYGPHYPATRQYTKGIGFQLEYDAILARWVIDSQYPPAGSYNGFLTQGLVTVPVTDQYRVLSNSGAIAGGAVSWDSAAGPSLLTMKDADELFTTTSPVNDSELFVLVSASNGSKFAGKVVLYISGANAGDGVQVNFGNNTITTELNWTTFGFTGNPCGATVGTKVSTVLGTSVTVTTLADTNTVVVSIEFSIVFDDFYSGNFGIAVALNSGSGTVTVHKGSTFYICGAS